MGGLRADKLEKVLKVLNFLEKRVEDGMLGYIIRLPFAGLSAKGRSMRDVEFYIPISVGFTEVLSVGAPSSLLNGERRSGYGQTLMYFLD